jgi:hypothetical protein
MKIHQIVKLHLGNRTPEVVEAVKHHIHNGTSAGRWLERVAVGVPMSDDVSLWMGDMTPEARYWYARMSRIGREK